LCAQRIAASSTGEELLTRSSGVAGRMLATYTVPPDCTSLLPHRTQQEEHEQVLQKRRKTGST
jgi:hypothetical protein